ncbi:MAG: polyprenyl synthetase family protein, partial [Pseudomonadota bacterium]
MNGPDGGRADWIIPELGFAGETERLRGAIATWARDTVPAELRDAVDWQFLAGSKYFRPLTVFSCARAKTGGEVPDAAIGGAIALELFHNMTLVVDDILDKSDERRGKATMHTKFGELKALMTSGYLVAEAYRMMAGDPERIALISELMTRLAVAECAQWRMRKQPADLSDWYYLAEEDTGSMFEIAACLGDPTGDLRAFGGLLGVLYHACDDVSDVRGTEALGEGGDEDIRDGILTLPAALAIRKYPEVAEMFRAPCEANYGDLAAAFRDRLEEAEEELDRIARRAVAEAERHARGPGRG